MPHPAHHRPKIAVLAAGIAALLAPLAPASVYTWDGNGTTTPNPNGGTGTWDVNTSLNWWNGANVVWPALGGLDDDALFANTAGTVSLAAGGVTANDLTFNTTGYLIQSNTLTLNGTTPTITTATSVSATITSVVAGSSGLTKGGNGTLVLTGANTYTGGTTISGGTLQIGNGTTNGTIGTGAYSITSGAKLLLNYATAATPTWANITGGGTVELNSAQAINGSANWGTVALPSGGTGFTGTLQLDRGRVNTNPNGLGSTTNVIIADGAQFLAFDGTANSYTFTQNFSIKGLGWGEAGQNLGALRVSTMNATFTGSITLTGASALYTQNSATSAITVTGVVSDGGSGFALTTNAAGTQPITLSNTGNSYGGDTIVGTGRLRLGASNVIPDGAGKGNVTVTGTFDLNTFSETINGLSGAGTVDNVAGAGSPVLTVGGNNATASFSGVIKNTTGTLNLTKTGTGTQTLTGTSTYTGATTVNSGALLLNAGVLSASSPVSIAAGATFGGKGTAGAVIVSPSGIVQGGVAGAGNLNLSGLTFTGNGSLNLYPASAVTASVAVTGAVTTSGTQTINIAGSPLAGGNYQLVSFTSLGGAGIGAFLLGTTPAQAVGSRPRVYTLDTTTAPASYVGLNVLADSAVWTGANNGTWDTGTPNNWKLLSNGNATTYFTADDVLFNDAAGTRTVVISGVDVTPNSLNFNNSVGNDYVFSGVNGIAGTTSLIKNGAGTVTIANPNTYTGGTTISAGTLQLGDGTANGTIAGNIANSAALSFRNGTAQTFANVISGAGTVTKNGNAVLTLSGTNTYTGTTIIANAGVLATGTLAPNGTASPIGQGTALTLDGGTLRYTGASNGNDTLTTEFNRAITVNSGGGTIDVAGSGFLFYNGVLTGSGNLAIVDSSGDVNNRQVLLTGNSPAFTGTVSVGNGTANSGWLQYRSAAAAPLGTATVTVNTGGILSTDTAGATLFPNNIVLNGGTLAAQAVVTTYSGSVTANPGTTSVIQTVTGAQTADISITGSLAGSGTIQELGATNSIQLRGNNAGFTGTYNHTGGAATLFYTGASASAAASWNIPAGSPTTARFMAAGTNATYQLGALSGATGLLENLAAASGNSTFEIGALNTNTTFGGVIADNGGTVAITKLGTGSLTLSGANTFTGATSVNAGTLLLSGGTLSTLSPISVAAGATFGGNGTGSATNVAASATIQGGLATGGGLNLSSLTFNGNAALNLLPNSATTSVAVAGSVTTSGTQTINITNPLPLPGGTYSLLSYGSADGAGVDAFKLGTTPTGVVGTRPRVYTLDTTVFSVIYLNVAADAPVWTGANNGNWDTTTTNNWNLLSDGVTHTKYFNADAVQFNDVPGTRTLVISGTDVTPATITFNNTAGNDYKITGTNGIAGATGLTMSGGGNLIIANANTYTGDTTVNSGTLQLGDGITNGVIAGKIVNFSSVVLKNATTQTYANVISSFGTVTKEGSGTFILTGANSYIGGTTINGGTLQLGDGTINGTAGTGTYTLASGTTLYLNYATAVAIPWANISGGGTVRLNSAQPVNGSANWTPGGFLTFPVAFTGTLQLDRGRVSTTPAGLGSATNVNIPDGSQFLGYDGSANGTAYTFPQNFSLSGMGWGEAGQDQGALRVSGMNATFTGNITLTGPTGFYTQANTLGAMTIAGPVSDGGAGYLVTINASGSAVTMSNPANNYTGNTLANVGVLKLGASDVIPDGAGKGSLTVTSTLDVNGFNETVNGLTGAGTIDDVAGAGTPVLTVGNNNATSTFDGVIKNTTGVLALTKTGTGTLTLTGVSSYSGITTVANGTLVISGNISGSAVALNGGKLGGTGTTSAVSIAAAGTLAPGASIGTLNTGTLTFNGGTLALEINTTAATTDLDNVSGDLALAGGGTLNVSDLGGTALAGGQVFKFIDYSGVWDGGIFTGHPDDSTFTVGLNQFRISYNGVNNDSTDVVLQSIPEPGAILSVLSGLGVLTFLRRRRHSCDATR